MFTDATRGSVSAMPEVGGSTWRLEDEMCSSGSESRGSSAGVTERQDPHVAMVPRPPAASRTWKKVAPSGERLVQQLSLDLPGPLWSCHSLFNIVCPRNHEIYFCSMN